VLILVGQDVFHPVNHTATDFKEKRPPANGPPTFQSSLGKVPSVSELLLIDVIAGEFGMVHGFAPLRCFRHERFLLRSYQVNSAVDGCVVPESCG
jgi:hypothetical protein